VLAFRAKFGKNQQASLDPIMDKIGAEMIGQGTMTVVMVTDDPLA